MTKRKATEEKRTFLNSHDISALLEETLSQFDFEHVYWLEKEEYNKAIGQLRRQVSGVFDFMKVDDKIPVRYMYGMGEGVDSAVEEIIKLAEDFGMRVRGIDQAISLEIIRRRNIMKARKIEEEK